MSLQTILMIDSKCHHLPSYQKRFNSYFLWSNFDLFFHTNKTHFIRCKRNIKIFRKIHKACLNQHSPLENDVPKRKYQILFFIFHSTNLELKISQFISCRSIGTSINNKIRYNKNYIISQSNLRFFFSSSCFSSICIHNAYTY